jgi:hypothetical protein
MVFSFVPASVTASIASQLPRLNLARYPARIFCIELGLKVACGPVLLPQ